MNPTEEPSIAFLVAAHDQPRIEIRVNFGIDVGRNVTAAEIDHLAEWLLDDVEAVTIVSEERHEIGSHVEGSVHQVRIELGADRVPADDFARKRLEERLIERADHWVRGCIADRHGDTAESLPIDPRAPRGSAPPTLGGDALPSPPAPSRE